MTKSPVRRDDGELRDRIESLERALTEAREEISSLRADARRAEVRVARLQTVVDTIPYPIFAKNNELRYTVCNPAFARYLGKASEEIIGKTVFEIADRDKAEVYHAADLALLQSGGTQSYEAKVQYHDGSDHDVIFHKAVLPNGQGGVDGMFGIICDITSLREAQKEQAELQEQLQHAQRLRSLGQLAGGVAHDLNNLLTPILGYSSLLLNGTPREDPRREQLDSIHGSAERAKDLVRQLLIFGRRQIVEFKPVDLSGLVSNSAGILRRTIREDIRVEVSLPETPTTVRADPGQIQQVLMNLAVNAQDAMPKGGSLRITVLETELDDAAASKHTGLKAGPHVLLQVEDSGCGIAPSIRQKIFDPFYTTKAAGRGTGLGLSIAYSIVKQHAGSITLDTELGVGTSFKIFLPRAATNAALEEPVGKHLDAPSGSETILVVEDEAGVRAFTRCVLGNLGYHVLAASTVENEFNVVEGQRESVDLLLTDVVMPVANGKEVFHRLRRSLPSLKVVYMSGYSQNVISHHGVLNEGVHFVQKPFTGAALAQKVRLAIDRPD